MVLEKAELPRVSLLPRAKVGSHGIFYKASYYVCAKLRGFSYSSSALIVSKDIFKRDLKRENPGSWICVV